MAARRKTPDKPRLMYSTATEKHYENGLAEFLIDDEWVTDDSNVIGSDIGRAEPTDD